MRRNFTNAEPQGTETETPEVYINGHLVEVPDDEPEPENDDA